MIVGLFWFLWCVYTTYEYSPCKPIDLKLTFRPLKLLLWGSYIIDILLVYLGGLGRPLAVNMAIDKNRLPICMKVTHLHPPAASKRYSTWSET